jgi:transposase
MLYVGLDVHQRTSSLCILNENGKVVKQEKIKGDWDVLLLRLAMLGRPWCVCFEAGIGYGLLHDKLAAMAQRVEVAHPGRLRLIFKSKQKNDRSDAKKLATLLFLDQVPQVWVPQIGTRKWRELVEFRARLVGKRTAAKSSLRTLLRSCGVRKLVSDAQQTEQGKRAQGEEGCGGEAGPAVHPRKGSAGPRAKEGTTAQPGLWGKQGMELLARLDLPRFEDHLRRDCLLDQIRQFDDQVKKVEKELDRIAASQAGVGLLRSAPGVGPRTAEAALAYIDDPHRFRTIKQVGAYVGLVPCQDASAGVHRLGHITKEGPGTLRWLLTEAAWQGIRQSPRLKAFYDQVCQGQKDRRKIALIATARHLLVVMLSMLRSGEVWREEGDPAAPAAVQVGQEMN